MKCDKNGNWSRLIIQHKSATTVDVSALQLKALFSEENTAL